MNGAVAVIGAYQSEFRTRDETRTFVEQAQMAAAGAYVDAGMTPDDVDAVVFSLAPTFFMGVADADRWALDYVFGAGKPVFRVHTGGATGGSALFSTYNTILSGMYDLGIAIGFDKHERGAFRVDTKSSGLGDWYGASGMALTTQFFGMKINRYMHEHGITNQSLARVSAKAFRNGALNPMAWRRKPVPEEEILDADMLSYPLTKYMFCSPAEGGVALILARADQAHKYTDTPIFLKAAVVRSRRFGSFEVLAPSIADEYSTGPTVDASKAAFSS